MLCLLQGCVLYTTKSYLLVIYIYIYYQPIYWVTTRHAYDVVNYVSMGAYPDIFFYPSSL